MLTHQGQHLLDQSLLFFIVQRLIPLARTALTKRPTRPTFGHAQLSLDMLDRLPPASRAQKFPWRASLRIALSSSASAKSFFNRLFSSSNCFSRLASSAFMPPY